MSPALPIVIHGRTLCPYAWRVRVTATEKGIPFEFVAWDAEPADPRAARNPDKRSPMLEVGDQMLRESVVIAQYLDEAFPGPSLQPSDPWERARTRFTITELEALGAGGHGPPVTAEQRAKIEGALDRIEALLADGRPFLGGAAPSLADTMAWPFLAWNVCSLDISPGAGRPAVTAWWSRFCSRPSFVETRCAWARVA